MLILAFIYIFTVDDVMAKPTILGWSLIMVYMWVITLGLRRILGHMG